MKRLIFILPLLFLCSHISFAQLQNSKWGDIPREHLEMKEFPDDPDASAVILFDIGDTYFDDNFSVIFTRHRRIKILSTAGFDWGSHAVGYTTSKRVQQVKGIEGVTYNLNEAGEMTSQKMDSKSVFDEKVMDSRRLVRFTLPALQPGSIIEYKYTVISHSPMYFPDWDFQTSEPVVWSEYRARVPNIFQYAIVTQGSSNFHIRKNEKFPHRNRMAQGMNHVWAMKDLPAIRSEPYITTTDDYITKMTFQLAMVSVPGSLPEKVLNTWEELIEELLNNKDFGKNISPNRAMRNEVAGIIEGLETDEEKISAIYKYVRDTMVWNSRYRIWADNGLNRIYETKTGNSGEIMMVLTAMLRAAGFDAHPVLLSTRRNGKIQALYPIYTQFNHAITFVATESKEYLLDATHRYYPMDLLPVPTLNDLGLLVRKGSVSWVQLKPARKASHQVLMKLTLDNDGGYKGFAAITDEGYIAAVNREKLAESSEEEFIKDFIKGEAATTEVDTFKILHKEDPVKSLQMNLQLTSVQYADIAGDFIYLNPTVLGKLTQNPLKMEKRTFPVDFAYERTKSYAIDLAVPEGYEVAEVPREVTLRLPRNGGGYRRVVNTVDGEIQIRRILEINQIVFRPEEYKTIRDFYGQIVSYDAEQIVLKRKSSPDSENQPAQSSLGE